MNDNERSYWLRAGQHAATMEPGRQSAIRSLATWLSDLRRRLIVARSIEVPWDRLYGLLTELVGLAYEDTRRAAAEMWILRGDWRYKSPKTLTLDDFFPRREWLELCGETVVTRDYMRRVVASERKKAYAEGLAAGKSSMASEGKGKRGNRRVSQDLQDMFSQRVELMERNDKLQRTIERRDREIAHLHARIAEFELRKT